MPNVGNALTAVEAAELLGVSRRSVIHAIKSGKLASVTKLPGKTGPFLLDREEVERYGVVLADSPVHRRKQEALETERALRAELEQVRAERDALLAKSGRGA
ncbi:helix-turn-helix domain-containing protein [Gordonia phosphorivorans]|uniref:Helix-turn-helix domain-containing protein n=1 Tax=Gordonia phosphorivorans TaxID=1056982 RepID=A0ABV6H993_9ACTN